MSADSNKTERKQSYDQMEMLWSRIYLSIFKLSNWIE